MANKPGVAPGNLSMEDHTLPPYDLLQNEPGGAAFCKLFKPLESQYLTDIIWHNPARSTIVPGGWEGAQWYRSINEFNLHKIQDTSN